MSLLHVPAPAAAQPVARWRIALFVFSIAVLAGPVSAHAAHKRNVKSHHRPVRRGAPVRLPPLRDGAGAPRELAAAGQPAPPKPVVAQAVQAPPPPKAAPLPPGRKGALRKGGKAAPTDEDLLEEAQAAYVRGERARAIEVAQAVAERGGPTAHSAWRFIGLAACSVRSQRLATRAYQNLQSQADQRVISDACKHNGLNYRDEQFVGD